MVTKENIAKILNNPNLTQIEKVRAIINLSQWNMSGGGGGGGIPPKKSLANPEDMIDDIDDNGEDPSTNNGPEGPNGPVPPDDDTSDFVLGMLYGKIFAETTFNHGGVFPNEMYTMDLPKVPEMKVIKK